MAKAVRFGAIHATKTRALTAEIAHFRAPFLFANA
jgi:hypothetical protein